MSQVTQKILMTSFENILTSLKIILGSLKNLKRHLTGEEKILIPSFKILMVSFGILVPSFLIINNNTYADESSNLDYAIMVEPSLNITTSAQDISLNLNPANHPFDTKDLTVSVGTNNETGYKLILNTIDNTTNLVEQNDNNLYIETLPSETDQTNFPGNRWGYKLDSTNTNYIPFTSNILISSSDKPTPTIITNTLSFAAKANYNTKAGAYNLALNFQATANPGYPDIQNLDPTLCTETPTTVIDNRDGQEYIIQRLKDGKCWMMTNLNLGAVDLEVEQLDSSNTNFTGSNASKTIAATTFLSPAWKKSSGSNAFTSPEYIPLDGVDHLNNMPYGTLYNYCAASGQTYCYNSNTNGGNASSDLCPAGWHLPTSGSSGDFQTLYSQSAYNSHEKMRAPIADGGAAFVFAGYFLDSKPLNQGVSGFYLSSTWRNNNDMYGFLIDSNPNVQPAWTSGRGYADSIRCLLK